MNVKGWKKPEGTTKVGLEKHLIMALEWPLTFTLINFRFIE